MEISNITQNGASSTGEWPGGYASVSITGTFDGAVARLEWSNDEGASWLEVFGRNPEQLFEATTDSKIAEIPAGRIRLWVDKAGSSTNITLLMQALAGTGDQGQGSGSGGTEVVALQVSLENIDKNVTEATGPAFAQTTDGRLVYLPEGGVAVDAGEGTDWLVLETIDPAVGGNGEYVKYDQLPGFYADAPGAVGDTKIVGDTLYVKGPSGWKQMGIMQCLPDSPAKELPPARAWMALALRNGSYTGSALTVLRLADRAQTNISYDGNGQVSGNSLTATGEKLSEWLTKEITLFAPANNSTEGWIIPGNGALSTTGTHFEFTGAGSSATVHNMLASDGILMQTSGTYRVEFDARHKSGNGSLEIGVGYGSPDHVITTTDNGANWQRYVFSLPTSTRGAGYININRRAVWTTSAATVWELRNVRFVQTSSSASIERWYDQSLEQNDLRQISFGFQPKIAVGNTASLSNSIGVDFGDSASYLELAGPIFTNTESLFVVSDGILSNFVSAVISGADNRAIINQKSDSIDYNATVGGITSITGSSVSVPQVFAFIRANGVVSAYQNSRLIGTSTSYASASIGRQIFGRRGDTEGNSKAVVSEILWFDSDQSTNRQKIEAMLAADHGITLTA